jgi:hypothetical protein
MRSGDLGHSQNTRFEEAMQVIDSRNIASFPEMVLQLPAVTLHINGNKPLVQVSHAEDATFARVSCI